MIATLWLKAAWGWLKRNWKWLLFPVGVLLFLMERSTSKRNVTVVSPGLVGHNEVASKLDEEAAQKKQSVDQAAAAQLSGIEAGRSAAVSAETQKQLDQLAEVQGDPAAVNVLLKQVGKDIRSK
jgi:hypothetical protein